MPRHVCALLGSGYSIWVSFAKPGLHGQECWYDECPWSQNSINFLWRRVDIEFAVSHEPSCVHFLTKDHRNNPLGKVFSKEEVTAICAFCVEHSIIILSDEVYDRLSYVPFTRPSTISPQAANLTLTVGSAGKAFFATGWRVGWVIGGEHLLKHVTRAHIQISQSAVTPLQEAVAVALEKSIQTDHWGRNNVTMLKRVKRLNAVWQDLGLPVSKLSLYLCVWLI